LQLVGIYFHKEDLSNSTSVMPLLDQCFALSTSTVALQKPRKQNKRCPQLQCRRENNRIRSMQP
jgi:hypothetical protein